MAGGYQDHDSQRERPSQLDWQDRTLEACVLSKTWARRACVAVPRMPQSGIPDLSATEAEVVVAGGDVVVLTAFLSLTKGNSLPARGVCCDRSTNNRNTGMKSSWSIVVLDTQGNRSSWRSWGFNDGGREESYPSGQPLFGIPSRKATCDRSKLFVHFPR